MCVSVCVWVGAEPLAGRQDTFRFHCGSGPGLVKQEEEEEVVVVAIYQGAQVAGWAGKKDRVGR